MDDEELSVLKKFEQNMVQEMRTNKQISDFRYWVNDETRLTLFGWLMIKFNVSMSKLSALVESALKYIPAAVLEPVHVQSQIQTYSVFDHAQTHHNVQFASVFSLAVQMKKAELLKNLFGALTNLVPETDDADTDSLKRVRAIQILNEKGLRSVSKTLGHAIKVGFGTVAVDFFRKLNLVSFKGVLRQQSSSVEQYLDSSDHRHELSVYHSLESGVLKLLEQLTVDKNAACSAEPDL